MRPVRREHGEQLSVDDLGRTWEARRKDSKMTSSETGLLAFIQLLGGLLAGLASGSAN
ncbi:hypothetical protein [Williamsia muralis]|uniref:hypothetical protein n=1 Tax=Williamsia marianensis TaxID=85044 RepID=UPI0012F87769|nr:hypothetical protein [Williamsia muralis]